MGIAVGAHLAPTLFVPALGIRMLGLGLTMWVSSPSGCCTAPFVVASNKLFSSSAIPGTRGKIVKNTPSSCEQMAGNLGTTGRASGMCSRCVWVSRLRECGLRRP